AGARAQTEAPPAAEPLALEGRVNLIWLCGVIATVFLVGTVGSLLPGPGARAAAHGAGLILFAGLSLPATPRPVHHAHRFSWAPIVEVAVVFVGIFITMVPALSFLEERGASLGVTEPWQFFWASGALSSVLDNAPTYLTFASLATGVANASQGAGLSASDL